MVRLFTLLLLLAFAGSPAAEDIDTFMEVVLANEKRARGSLQRYIFAEDEVLDVVNTATDTVVERRRATYTWFEKAGGLVRSPLSINGVPVGEGEQLRYENEWLNGGKKGKRRADIAEDTFFNFSYEPGAYAVVERTEVSGRPALVVEYYPQEHFQNSGRDPIGSRGDRYDASFDKTSTVTYVVDLQDRRIISVSFSNAQMNYLPYRWLVETESFYVEQTSGHIASGAWVPKDFLLRAEISQAEGTFEVTLRRSFRDYRRAGVSIDFDIVTEPDDERQP